YHVWKPRRQDVSSHPRWAAASRIGSVVLLLAVIAASVGTGVAITRAPEIDDFADYTEPLGAEPGVLLRAEPFDTGMPDNSVATRILYTTNELDGQITLATGIVILPSTAPSEP